MKITGSQKTKTVTSPSALPPHTHTYYNAHTYTHTITRTILLTKGNLQRETCSNTGWGRIRFDIQLIELSLLTNLVTN